MEKQTKNINYENASTKENIKDGQNIHTDKEKSEDLNIIKTNDEQ